MRGGTGSSGRSLADRTGSAPPPTPTASGHRRRHCWVLAPGSESPCPGLIVEWRREPDGWRARVTYVLVSGGEVTTVDTWVGASMLRPVEPR